MFYVADKKIFRWKKNHRVWFSKNGIQFNSIEEMRKEFQQVKRCPAFGQVFPERLHLVIDWDALYESQSRKNPIKRLEML